MTRWKPLIISAAICCLAAMAAVALVLRVRDMQSSAREQVDRQVLLLRMHLWKYYAEHGSAPSQLRLIVPGAGEANSIQFVTWGGISCMIKYQPSTGDTQGVVARLRCGDPVLAVFAITKDGRVARSEYYPHFWWRVLWQKHVADFVPASLLYRVTSRPSREIGGQNPF
jgi:hypothetical protein